MTALTDVPTRQQWRAHEEARQGQIVVQAMTAFGWKVHRHVMPVGSRMVIRATGLVPRSQSPNLTLYTRGRFTVTSESGVSLDDRVPGMFSAERPDHPAGVVTLEAVEPSEFWCFNWHANRGSLPSLGAIRLADGGSLQSPQGQRVILCIGQLGGHQEASAFVCDGSAMASVGQVYGFLVGGDRA